MTKQSIEASTANDKTLALINQCSKVSFTQKRHTLNTYVGLSHINVLIKKVTKT